MNWNWQTIAFSLFYFSKDYAILPTFSRLRALSKIKPKPTDKGFLLLARK